MQRTYRAKKPVVSGGLDSKEFFLSDAEKKYNFDVYSIRSIKETKREISCTNTFTSTSSRVRKRKYVKKYVKEVEPTLRESLESQSTYLTPDKSLRVNKAQDAFDLLFASLSPKHNNDGNNKAESQQKPIVQRNKKAYGEKNDPKRAIKKFNYSTSSGSEKENDSNNKSDIRKHEFIIEKEKKKPEAMEDSIDQLKCNVSLLKFPNTQYLEANSSCTNNRLTNNLHSPCITRSPLCSTPFSKKLRGKSIYSKFSPILSKAPNARNENEMLPAKHKIVEDIESNEEVYEADKKANTSENYVTKDFNKENHISNKPLPEDIISVQNLSKLSQSNIHSHSSITTPFYGFPDNIDCAQDEFLVSPVLPTTHRKSIILQSSITGSVRHAKSNHTNKTSSNSSIFCDNTDNIEKDKSIHINEFVELSVEQEPFLGFSEKTIADSNKNNQNIEIHLNCSDNKDAISINSNNYSYIDATIIEGELVSAKKSDTSDNLNQTGGNNSNEEYDSFDSANNSIKPESEVSKESMYDTICDSSDEDENIGCTYTIKQPVVKLSRIDQELFDQYWNPTDKNEESLNVSLSSSNAADIDCHSNDEEEPHMSFVTTRRRNDVTRNSSIQVINEFDDSFGCSEGDMTVLGKNILVKEIENPVKTEIQCSEYLQNETKSNNTGNANEACNISRVTFANASASQPDESRPAIVLKPGKKWERSLCIYKRMTMLNDTDTSLLEDLEMKRKGRKYRESIIDTMELQERGPLHNESFSSCRNAYAYYKPSRSTVRIAKECSNSRLSVHSTRYVFHDISGFLSEDCDDTLVELSKLSIAEDHEVTVLEKRADEAHDRAPTARDYVLRRCNQTEVLLFDECYPDTVLKNCHKIGEGVYGEVFLWRAQDHARVMKVVPVSGTIKVNGEPQKDFHEIISEIVIAMELSALRSPIANIERHLDENTGADALDLRAIENATDVFNEVLAVRCVIGKYPSRLLDLWELYDECKGSENDNPADLPLDQQYIVLELANAGLDLESYHFNNAEQAYALFLQVAFGLAVGEEAFQFEHRDFHWGNVLIAPTEQKYATFVLRGRVHRILRRGVAATIIDYSYSRLSLPLGDGERVALYNDLSTEEGLFDAVGDYQFDIYRLMRDKLMNNWKSFEPYTNVLWLHYTVDKMITALRYKRINTKIHKHFISKLKGIKNRILDYESVVQFVLTDNEF